MDFDDQLNEYIVDIFEKIDSVIVGDYKDVWFRGEITTPQMNSVGFWYLDDTSKLIMLVDMADIKMINQKNVDDMEFELSHLLRKVAEVFADNGMTVFNNIIIHYTVNEAGSVSMEMSLEYIDWFEAGFDDLDQMNYYLVQTVGEEYIQGLPEKRQIYLDEVEKMQKYATEHK